MKLQRRIERLNTGLLIVGLGCIAGAVFGAGLSIGEVSTKGLSTPGAIILGVVGGLLIGASLVVGVDVAEPGPRHDGPPQQDIAGSDERLQLVNEKTRLRSAAAALISALRKPDDMKRNVNRARKLVEAAFADTHDITELQPLARSLLAASQSEDLSAATLVLNQLDAPNI
jgi:hypothetical protein